MSGSGSTPVSAMRPANTDTTEGTAGLSASATPCTCSRVSRAVTLSLTPLGGQFLDERQRGFAPGVGDGNLDVDVFLPVADFQALAAHLVELVAEHLEGDRLVLDHFEQPLGEGLVVGDADLFHQGGIGGQPLDERFAVQVEDALAVGAVGEDFNGKIRQQFGAHEGARVRGEPPEKPAFSVPDRLQGRSPRPGSLPPPRRTIRR